MPKSCLGRRALASPQFDTPRTCLPEINNLAKVTWAYIFESYLPGFCASYLLPILLIHQANKNEIINDLQTDLRDKWILG
jgi:hypothetical protein